MKNSLADLSILHKIGVPLHPRKWVKVDSYFWELPNHGEIKINTDRAARGNPGKGSIGCNFRDSEAWVKSDSKAPVEAFHSENIPWIKEAEWAIDKRSMQQIKISATWKEANFSANALSK
ncbi:hypothetical protein GIB67_009895 [Kingdonia uniflora]|uniref:Uncharacterized protein n=1 Tax=Kingdonia uniflora TaxID=39325 RepID=A0A7J7L7U3_9MAGN|nr:hypothetical protein GIB67_009895 [Kingdonia uniflora]